MLYSLESLHKTWTTMLEIAVRVQDKVRRSIEPSMASFGVCGYLHYISNCRCTNIVMSDHTPSYVSATATCLNGLDYSGTIRAV
ncbi:hypothetical protein RHMOL_Rhmol06G0310900 [Rhododendron molle]|uniref:Uncharacterized protein n=1 Tax=Rhododendron molle TaxID=49168 RepID=A0ACC0NIB1_RHOML|nr:hypothetical protein RHMOL_Rhmol06G0310900 [Rhododendron molle]